MTVEGDAFRFGYEKLAGENLRRRTKCPKSPVFSRGLNASCAEGRDPGSSPGHRTRALRRVFDRRRYVVARV